MHGPPSLAARPAEIALEGKSMNTNVAFLQLSRINIFRRPPSTPLGRQKFHRPKTCYSVDGANNSVVVSEVFHGGLAQTGVHPSTSPRWDMLRITSRSSAMGTLDEARKRGSPTPL